MAKATAQRWEYTVVRPPRDETRKEAENPQAVLDAHGEDGWELTATIDYSGGGTKFLVFKRPIETETDVNDGDAT